MNEQSILLAVLAIDDPAERSAYLDRACAGDTDLRSQVEQLLNARQEPGRSADRTAPELRAEGSATPAKMSETLREAPADDTDVQELTFLTPSARPGVLGRLGRYDVLAVIGRGGMGVVLRAFDEQLNRTVAIKVMAAHLATNATARKRFLREARTAAAVCHDHVVTIHAVEEARGLPYLVMKYVPGQNLKQRLDREGPLPLPEVLRIGTETASGLAAAHARGLVHRDIKPANILLEGEAGASATGGRVKITDFGLARAADDASLTQSGVVAGTPDFMSPEQARGEALDARTDLFSLGSVLYAMCTGQAPFHAADTLTILHRVCEETPTPIREINPEIPGWLVSIIEKLLAKEPARRFQSAAEVAEVLQRYLLHPPQPQPAAGALPEEKSGARPRRPLSWWWRIVALAAGAALLLAAAGGLLSLRLPRVETGDGTLVVEADDPEVEVALGQFGVTVHDRATDRMYQLKPGEHPLRPGEYQLEVIDPVGGLRLFMKEFTIRGGDRVPVKVTIDARLARWLWEPVGEVRRFETGGAGDCTVAFSPDGRLALSGGDNFLHLWDVATGKEVRRMEGHTAWIIGVACSPDGERALSGGADQTVRLWDLATGKELKRLDGHSAGVRAVAFLPGGRQAVSAGVDKVARLWDLENGTELRRFEGHTAEVRTLAVFADGKRLLSGSLDKSVRLWDVESGKELLRFDGHTGGVMGVAVSPDGRLAVSTGFDSTVRLWDVESGKELRRLDGHTAWTKAPAFSPDGRRVLSCGHDKTVRLWDVESGRELNSFEGHTRAVWGAAYSPDGRYGLSASEDGTLRLWRLPDPRRPPNLQTGDGAPPVEFAEKALEQAPFSGQVLNTLGTAYYRAGRWQDAIRTLDMADAVGYGEETWFSPFILAMAHWQDGDREQARKLYRVGLVWLARRGAADEKLLRLRAEAASLLGLSETMSPEEEQVRADDEKYYSLVLETRPDATWASFPRGRLLEQRKEWDKAAADYRRVVEILEVRVAKRPLDALCRQKLAWAHQELAGVLLYHLSKPQEAAKSRRRQVELFEGLVRDFPKGPGNREQLGHSYRWLAFDSAKVNQPLEAEKAYGRAIETLETLVADFPDKPNYYSLVADTYDRLRQLLAANGKAKEAAEAFDNAVRVLGSFPVERATTPEVRASLADLYHRRGNMLREAERPGEAEAAYRQAVAVRAELAAEYPRERSHRQELGRNHNWLGIVLGQQGRLGEAETEHREALNIYEKLTKENDPTSGHWHRRELAWTYLNLGEALEKEHWFEEAMELYGRAGELCEKLAVEKSDGAYPYWGSQGYSKRACLLTGAGQTEEARDVCRKILAFNPPLSGRTLNLAARNLITSVYPRYRAPDLAIELSQKAVQLDPTDVDTIQTLGVAQYRAGESEAAIATLMKAQEIGPQSFDSIAYVLAMAHRKLGNEEQARKWYSPALVWTERQKSNGDELLRLRAEAASLLGLPEKLSPEQEQARDDEVKLYTLVLEANPEAAWAYLQRGRAFGKAQQWDKAAAEYTKAIELRPNAWEAWSDRAFVAFNRQQWDAAVSDFSRAIDLAPNVHTNWWHRGHAYLRLAQWDKAAADFGKVIEQWPDQAEAWNLRGVARSRLGQKEEALADYVKASELNPRAALYWSNRGSVCAELKRFDQAVADDSKAIELKSDEGSYWNNRANAFAELGQWDKASADFEKAVELRANDPLPRYRLALVHLQRGDQDAYRKVCADMLDRFGQKPDTDPATWTLWTCVLGPDAVSDWKPVVGLAEKALAADPKNYDRLQLLGAVLCRAGRFEEAARRLVEAEAEFAEAKNPRSTIVYTWLFQAMTQFRLGQAEEGRRWLDKALEAIEQPPEKSKDAGAATWNRRLTLQLWQRELAGMCLKLGEALEKDRRVEEAMELYRRAGALCEKLAVESPNSTDFSCASQAYGNLAILLAAADRPQEAEQACRKVLELKPTYPLAHFKYALLRLHLGGRDAHRAACADMLARFGNSPDPEAAYWTAWTCTLAPDAVSDWQPVVRLAEKALAADPKNCDRLQLLGTVLYRAGRFKEALQRLTEAEAAFPEAKNPVSTVFYNWLFQAMTRQRLGQADEARKWLDKAAKAIDQPPDESGDPHAGVWNRRLTLQLWLREAQERLGKE